MDKIAYMTGYMEKNAGSWTAFLGGGGALMGGLSPYKGHSRLESMGRSGLKGGGLGLGFDLGGHLSNALGGGFTSRQLTELAAGIGGWYGGNKLADYLFAKDQEGKAIPQKDKLQKVLNTKIG